MYLVYICIYNLCVHMCIVLMFFSVKIPDYMPLNMFIQTSLCFNCKLPAEFIKQCARKQALYLVLKFGLVHLCNLQPLPSK